MKSLLIYISFLFITILHANNIDLYYVENVVTIQSGKKFDYSIDFQVKTYDLKNNTFSDVDECTSCKKPLKLVKAPLEKWVIVLEYKVGDSDSKDKRDKLINKLKENFKLEQIKKDSNNGSILSYYEIKRLDNPIKNKTLNGVKILQNEDTYSKKVIIPPNDNFVLLKSVAIDERGKYYKSDKIKITSSCGKLKIKDSSRFSFTFFNDENICSIYAKVGKYMDIIEVIKLNKDGSMPSNFNILYKAHNVDKINIDYYTFKTKGIILKSDIKDNSLKWINKNNNLSIQLIKDGIMVYPKKKLKKYQIELVDIKKGISDNLTILIKNE